MVKLLEIREEIINFYKKYERFLAIIGKFIFALIVIVNLNQFLGLNAQLNNPIATVGISAISVFLPGSWFILLLIFFICGHIYTISIELLVVLFAVMLVLYLLFVRVFPKQAYFVVLVPLAFMFKMGYVVPILAGLFAGPTAIVAIGTGVLINKSAAYLPGLLNIKSEELYDIPETVITMIKYILNSVMEDKAMMLTVVVFALVTIVVYIVSRFSYDYIWYIAIGIGAVVNILAFVIGILFTHADISIGGVILGTIFAVIISVICQFMRFSLNYNRQAKVQFEDDDYYYYVKAIPKTKVAKSEKAVKKIK